MDRHPYQSPMITNNITLSTPFSTLGGISIFKVKQLVFNSRVLAKRQELCPKTKKARK